MFRPVPGTDTKCSVRADIITYVTDVENVVQQVAQTCDKERLAKVGLDSRSRHRISSLQGKPGTDLAGGNEQFSSGTQKRELAALVPWEALPWSGEPPASLAVARQPRRVARVPPWAILLISLCRSFLGSGWAHLMRGPDLENKPSPVSSLGECQPIINSNNCDGLR